MSNTPEGKVKTKIDNWLKKTFPRAFWYKPVSMGYGKHGIPDYICCVPKVITQDMVGQEIGMFVGIEAKSEKGGLSAHQSFTIGEILDAAGVVEIVYGTGERFDRSAERLVEELK